VDGRDQGQNQLAPRDPLKIAGYADPSSSFYSSFMVETQRELTATMRG
jgi:hypothetical protein